MTTTTKVAAAVEAERAARFDVDAALFNLRETERFAYPADEVADLRARFQRAYRAHEKALATLRRLVG